MSDWVVRWQFAYTVLVGACLGSFTNVVIARLPEKLSVLRPRSRCPQCLTPIAWYDNVPILSFILLRARCRYCGASIALRYVLVELLMAGLAAALFLRFGVGYNLLVWLPLTTALLAITFLDIDHWWVPDVVVYPAIVWVVLTAWLPGRPAIISAAIGVLPALLLWGVGWIFEKVTHKEGLGFGDIKLLGLLGLSLGLQDALTALILAATQGALVGTVVILRGGHGHAPEKTPAALADDADWQPHPHAIPFGPFLALAALQVVLLPQVFAVWHQRLVDWLALAML